VLVCIIIKGLDNNINNNDYYYYYYYCDDTTALRPITETANEHRGKKYNNIK
jgi:hypothetical protein